MMKLITNSLSSVPLVFVQDDREIQTAFKPILFSLVGADFSGSVGMIDYIKNI